MTTRAELGDWCHISVHKMVENKMGGQVGLVMGTLTRGDSQDT